VQGNGVAKGCLVQGGPANHVGAKQSIYTTGPVGHPQTLAGQSYPQGPQGQQVSLGITHTTHSVLDNNGYTLQKPVTYANDQQLIRQSLTRNSAVQRPYGLPTTLGY
jgi:hypothetical protein